VSIVEEYWAGVLQRLNAEVHVFAQLVTHEGERGRENEAVIARILQALVPQRYGIGSGLLIDTANQYSRQTDIVVYEQSDEPAVLAQTTQLLFPIESVLACIEVKTTLRADDVADCLAKARHMRTLRPARRYPDGSTHPLFAVLAYRAGQQPATLAKKFHTAQADERPDLVCIVEQGLLAGADGSIRNGSQAMLDSSLVLLVDGGEPIEGKPTGRDMRQVHRGRQFPIVRYGERLLLVEPSRGLLLFVEALVRRLAEKQARPVPVISHYVNEQMRELAWHAPDGSPEEGGARDPATG
jgi:hypothetical protein